MITKTFEITILIWKYYIFWAIESTWTIDHLANAQGNFLFQVKKNS
jgi:hypothetical protein